MKRQLPLLLTAFLALSCGSKSSSPSSPGGGGGGGGNSSLTTPMLEATLEDNNGTIGADVNIASSSGPVSNASVTLSSAPTGNIVVVYTGSNATLPVSISGGLSDITFGIYQATGWTYTASQPYTVTASVGGTTYKANITAVGNITIDTAGGGSAVTCSWTNAISTSSANPQNISQFSAKNSSYATIFTDPSPVQAPFLASPVTIAASSLSSATTVTMDTGTVKLSAFPGSFTGSFIESNCEAQTAY